MREKKPTGNEYKTPERQWYWAVMYKPSGRSKPYVTILYPRWREAKQHAIASNREWTRNGWRDAFSVKRFAFYFRGSEIDAYEHEWSRVSFVPNLIRKDIPSV